MLVGFEDGVVRVLNFQKKEVVDVHGRKQKDQSELFLKQAIKPHNQKVVSMAVDSKGEILATGVSCVFLYLYLTGYTCYWCKLCSSLLILDWLYLLLV